MTMKTAIFRLISVRYPVRARRLIRWHMMTLASPLDDMSQENT